MKKNKIIYILLGFMAVVFAACQKSFLDVNPPGQESPAVDPTLAAGEVTAAYNGLISPNPSNTTSDEVHGWGFVTVTNIISDDADKGSYSLDQPPANDIDNFTLNANNTYVENLWRGHYDVIARTNAAIRDLPKSGMDSATIVEQIAEMRFIRGYLYFNLVRMFGGVPLVLTVPTGPLHQDSSFYYRSTASVVYNNGIIPDLLYAAAHLPVKGNTDVGRATKGAAQGLLSKVYLYLQNWQQAYNYSDSVIISGLYQLVPDYSTIWREVGDNNAESLFEIETGIYGNADYGVPEYCEFQGPRQDNGQGTPTTAWNNPGSWIPSGDMGWGFDMPSTNLLNAYEPGDKRLAATIINLPANGPPVTLFDGTVVPTMVGISARYNYKAWHSEMKNQIEVFFGDRSHKQKNIHILRYAEILLINAEAAAQLSNSATALNDLNQVRNRAGLPNASIADQNAIWNERHIELAMEHDRFWDLVRTGRAAQVMIASGKTNFVAGKNELLPIPAVEISLSAGTLKQNPGY